MTVQLLPTDFDAEANKAVQHFWAGRGAASSGRQGGTRDAVTGGANMDGFLGLLRKVATHAGLPEEAVFTRKSTVVLPGYFRATKNWDALVIHRKRLLGVFEFKSQVGSFGNNFNNRSEEVIGSAADLWIAHHHGAYSGLRGERPPPSLLGERVPLLNPELHQDPRPPFVAWLMLLEDCPGSQRPISVDEPHYPVFPEFFGVSYAERYRILCERLMERQLYSSAALLLSSPDTGAATGSFRAASEATSLRSLFAEFAGRIAAAGSTEG